MHKDWGRSPHLLSEVKSFKLPSVPVISPLTNETVPSEQGLPMMIERKLPGIVRVDRAVAVHVQHPEATTPTYDALSQARKV